MSIKTQYDKVGRFYIEGQKNFYTRRKNQAKEFIKNSIGEVKNKKLLDIGCGSGNDSLEYHKMGANVFGIDPSKYMADHARQKKELAGKIKVAGAEKIPFANSYFDVAVGRYSLHYIKNLDIAYKEIARVLKRGGLLSLVLPHPLYDLLKTKELVYGKKQMAQASLYKGNVVVKYPSHTFEEYFSPTFLKLFDVQIIQGYNENEPFIRGVKAISGICILAIKR